MPRKLVRRYKGRKKHRKEERSSPKHNPPVITELAEFIGPGFAGFAAARFATYLAVTQVSKQKPTWGKPAGAVTAAAVFAAAWLLAHRWKWLAKYQMPLVVGAGIAALQSIIQLYVPKVGWMISDSTPQLAAATTAATAKLTSSIPTDFTSTNEDPGLYEYNDSHDAGRMSPQSQPTAQQQTDDDLSDLNLDDMGQQQNMGVFGG